MRQRNDTDQPLTVHTDPPQVVEPGQTIDDPAYVVGLTVLDDEPAPAAEADGQDPESPTQAPPRRAARGRSTDTAQED